MRNLKKILALVLALVMSLSVMSIASAEFKDAESINEQYVDAVEVLSGLGIFTGYEDAEGNFTFNPTGLITRKEVAALIYRIDSADMSADGSKIHADWNKFVDDVPATSWYAGYVNYCAGSGFIRGRSETSFDPDGYVTGYEVLAMILRVVGYDKNNEYAGPKWQENVFSDARKLGLLGGFATGDTLGAHASRQLVAELLFRTIKDVVQVEYTPFMGYRELADIGNGRDNTVGYDRFGLLQDKNWYKNDKWGHPYAAWETEGWNRRAGRWVASDIPGTVHYEDMLTEAKNDVMDHCCIYDLMKDYVYVDEDTKKAEIVVWYNGLPVVEELDPYSTMKTFGGKGTLMEIYAGQLVIIDTYLAEVTTAVKQTTDKAGHVKVAASNEFTIYSMGVDANGDEILVTTVETEEYAEKTPAYEKGTFLLVNYNKAEGKMYIAGEPTIVDGKQTRIWRNSDKHTINGEDKDDNANFALNVAGTDRENAYRWYFDAYGNVIGAGNAPENVTRDSYAVVLGIYWRTNGFDNSYACAVVQTLGSETTELVQITSIDKQPMMYAGTAPALDAQGKVDVKAFRNSGKTFHEGFVYTTYQYNLFTTEHMYKITFAADANKDGLKVASLAPVNTHLDAAILQDGYSEILNNEGKSFATPLFTDNETVYYILENGTLKSYQGYTNLPEEVLVCKNIDYVTYKDGELFIDLMYIESAAAPEEEEDEAEEAKPVESYVYFTNDAYHYQLGETFVLKGVVDAAGNATTLNFTQTHFGTVAATWETLDIMQDAYNNHLCKVTTLGGYVTKIELVDAKTDIFAYSKGKVVNSTQAQFFTEGTFQFDDKGVLLIDGNKLPLNCTETTMLFNNEGELETKDLETIAELLAEFNFYVIYNRNTRVISAIFLTDVEKVADMNDPDYVEFVGQLQTMAIQMMADIADGEAALTAAPGLFNYTYVVEADCDTLTEIKAAVATNIDEIKADLVEWFNAKSNVVVAFELFGVEIKNVSCVTVNVAEPKEGVFVATATFNVDGKALNYNFYVVINK